MRPTRSITSYPGQHVLPGASRHTPSAESSSALRTSYPQRRIRAVHVEVLWVWVRGEQWRTRDRRISHPQSRVEPPALRPTLSAESSSGLRTSYPQRRIRAVHGVVLRVRVRGERGAASPARRESTTAQARASMTKSRQRSSALTSAGSTETKVAIRSWLRPSFR
ncbi:Uncharacterised protein [Mycobacteroides abscessus subsp. abscessus]|nr:Uncharacterised protein [Mycobacteroides abscessus subsp. abscessus]